MSLGAKGPASRQISLLQNRLRGEVHWPARTTDEPHVYRHCKFCIRDSSSPGVEALLIKSTQLAAGVLISASMAQAGRCITAVDVAGILECWCSWCTDA